LTAANLNVPSELDRINREGKKGGVRFIAWASMEIQVKQIGIRHGFSCCFKLKQRGTWECPKNGCCRKLHHYKNFQAGLLDQVPYNFFFDGIQQTAIQEKFMKINLNQECFWLMSSRT